MREKEKKNIKFFLFWHFQVMQTSDMSHGGGEVTNTKLWYYWFHSSHFSVVHLSIYLFIYFYLLVHSIAIVCDINVRKSKSILFKHKDVVVLVVFSQCWALEGFLLCYETSEMSKGVQLLIFARPMVDSSWAILQENKFWFLCSCKQRDNFTVTTVTKPKKQTNFILMTINIKIKTTANEVTTVSRVP